MRKILSSSPGIDHSSRLLAVGLLVVIIGIIYLVIKWPFFTVSPPPLVSATGAIIKTNYGDIGIEFSPKSPVTVASFISLAKSGFFNGTRIHRIIKNFMIQGGDPLTKDMERKYQWGHGGPGYVIPDEIHPGEHMVRGVVAMANNGPNTNGSQFFIITADRVSWLDGQNTIFATVISGRETVDAISKIPTDILSFPLQDVIVSEVLIRS